MNIQHLEVSAGETRTLSLKARDPSNLPLNLAGKTVSWRVGRSPRNLDSALSIFNKTGTVTNATAGEFTVPIALGDTQYMQGDYRHAAVVDNVVVVAGRFRVLPSIEA